MVRRIERFVVAALGAISSLKAEGQVPPFGVWLGLLRDLWSEAQWPGGRVAARFDPDRLDESYARWLTERAYRPLVIPSQPAPRIVVLVPGRDTLSLTRAVDSLIAQSWPHWQAYLALCAQDSALRAAADAHAAGDPRIRVCQSDKSVSEIVRDGDYLIPVPSAAWLPSDALAHVVAALAEEPADWLYTDEDHVVGGRRIRPRLKGQFSPALARSDDYATALAAVRTPLLPAGAPLSVVLSSSGLSELLRGFGGHPAVRIAHLPAVCIHRPPAEATAPRTRCPREDTADRPPVTVVVPTRDRVDLLGKCVAALRSTLRSQVDTLIVVDDGSERPETQAFLRDLNKDSSVCRVVRVERTGQGFNYAALMNRAAELVTTPLMLHLNDDVHAMEPGWLDAMTAWFRDETVGIVGARLVYPSGAIQHAGVILNARRGLPLHLFSGLSVDDPGYLGRADLAQDVAAVTGACLLTRTALYRELGGLDAELFPVQYNDVDYCLRAGEKGFRTIYEPGATLLHLTGASRGRAWSAEENRAFVAKYGGLDDPWWSPHLEPRSLATSTPRMVLRRPTGSQRPR